MIIERDVTRDELARFDAERDREAHERGTTRPDALEIGVVAREADLYLGCAVAHVHVHSGGHVRWAYLAELFLEESHRRRGLGRAMLEAIEQRVAAQGVRMIWTRTAEYEAPAFYRRLGYTSPHTFPHWYPSGHGNVLFRKTLEHPAAPRAFEDRTVTLHDRMPTPAELTRTAEGFVEHGRAFGNPRETSERIGFVATQDGTLVGYVSGLVRRAEGLGIGRWCTLTDFWVSTASRDAGIGSALLDAMHTRLRALGVGSVELWTPSFQGVAFMLEHRYTVCTELEGWYPGGHGRIALCADLDPL